MSNQDDIELWLKYLGQALHRLPEAERADIVGEARGHLEERIEAGLSASSALAGFGKAQTYAQAFLDDYALTQALESQRSVAMVRVLFSFASRSLAATLGLVCFLVFAATTLAAIACILVKLVRPELVGLWSGPGGFALGIITDHLNMQERLGNWIYLWLTVLVLVDAALARFCLIVATKGVRGKETTEAI